MVHPRNRIFNNYGVLQNEDRIHMKAENDNGTTQQCLGVFKSDDDDDEVVKVFVFIVFTFNVKEYKSSSAVKYGTVSSFLP